MKRELVLFVLDFSNEWTFLKCQKTKKKFFFYQQITRQYENSIFRLRPKWSKILFILADQSNISSTTTVNFNCYLQDIYKLQNYKKKIFLAIFSSSCNCFCSCIVSVMLSLIWKFFFTKFPVAFVMKKKFFYFWEKKFGCSFFLQNNCWSSKFVSKI